MDILDHKIPPNNPLRQVLKDGEAPLIKTFSKISILSYRSLARILIEKGADPNVADSSGNTLLLIVCEKDFTYLGKLLLEKGAKPNVVDKNGMTPLKLAMKSDNLELVKLLLDHGATPTQESKDFLLKHGG